MLSALPTTFKDPVSIPHVALLLLSVISFDYPRNTTVVQSADVVLALSPFMKSAPFRCVYWAAPMYCTQGGGGVYLLLDLTPSPCHPCFEHYLSQSSTFIVRFMKTWVAGGCNHRARKRPGHCSGVYCHQFDFTCFLPSSLAKRDKELFTPTVRLF